MACWMVIKQKLLRARTMRVVDLFMKCLCLLDFLLHSMTLSRKLLTSNWMKPWKKLSSIINFHHRHTACRGLLQHLRLSHFLLCSTPPSIRPDRQLRWFQEDATLRSLWCRWHHPRPAWWARWSQLSWDKGFRDQKSRNHLHHPSLCVPTMGVNESGKHPFWQVRNKWAGRLALSGWYAISLHVRSH